MFILRFMYFTILFLSVMTRLVAHIFYEAAK